MVSAKTRELRWIAPRLDHALGQLLEERVASLPPESVVDRFEALDIEDEQSELVLLALGGMQELLQVLLEERPVGEPCKLVVVGQVVQLFGFRDVLEGERDVARQLEQQLHLLIVEKCHLAGVEREHSDSFLFDH